MGNKFEEQHKNYTRPKKICGIYCITNLYNNKKYIGKSIDIIRRYREHCSHYEHTRTPDKPLYRAMEKYGIEAFSLSIIEECNKEELNEKEKYWIQFYNSDNREKGYNIRPGGDGWGPGEEHDNHKLTEADVIDIRTRYNNHERKYEVEELYKDKIGHSGFHKIWNGETWAYIMPEVYTEENKKFHRNNTGQKGSKNGRALLSEDDVRTIRSRKRNGEKIRDVYEDYKHTGITLGSFRDVWNYHNWKHVE